MNEFWNEYWKNYNKYMKMFLREMEEINSFTKVKYVNPSSFVYPSFEVDDEVDEIVDNYNSPAPKVSPGGGKFTIENCKKSPIVRIEMKKGYNPSSYYMVVDRYDNKSISGYRVVCEEGRVKFKAMSVEYKDISFIECAF